MTYRRAGGPPTRRSAVVTPAARAYLREYRIAAIGAAPTGAAHGSCLYREPGRASDVGRGIPRLQARRPDYERWELLAGIPMSMPPPTIPHNCLPPNPPPLLTLSLNRHNPPRPPLPPLS